MEPRTYDSPVELETAADCYFAHCDEAGGLYGEAGLALGLGVDLQTLRKWYDGADGPEIQAVVRRAYLRIQDQIETGEVYRDKNLHNRAVFLLKQRRLGGYQDKAEVQKPETKIRVIFGKNVDASDFQ